jgi:CBS domain-containing protein
LVKKKVAEFARTDLVKKPVTSSIQDIAKIMKGGLIGSVFLVDSKGKIAGLVTDRALFGLIADGKNPLLSKPVDLMEQLVMVDQEKPALDVLALMNEKGLSRVGTTGPAGELVGIVSKKKLQFEQLRILKCDLGIEE